MIDSVVSVHTDPRTCGVAAFNVALAKRLGVPLVSADEARVAAHLQSPLLSVRLTELKQWLESTEGQRRDFIVPFVWAHWCAARSWGLFLHDWAYGFAGLVNSATYVFCATPELGDLARADTPGRGIVLWCPAEVVPAPKVAAVNVITFAMSNHPVAIERYATLARWLNLVVGTAATDWSLRVSWRAHDGTPWREDVAAKLAALRQACGEDHVVDLGMLSTTSLMEEMNRELIVALFYEPALRANCTSFWTAMQSRATIISNCDDLTPPQMRTYCKNVEILLSTRESPKWWLHHAEAPGLLPDFGWDRLIDRITHPLDSCEKVRAHAVQV